MTLAVELVELEVPLIAPHAPAEIEDVVVGDDRTSHPVAELEGAQLVGRAVVPDDPRSRSDALDPVAVGKVEAAKRRVATARSGARPH